MPMVNTAALQNASERLSIQCSRLQESIDEVSRIQRCLNDASNVTEEWIKMLEAKKKELAELSEATKRLSLVAQECSEAYTRTENRVFFQGAVSSVSVRRGSWNPAVFPAKELDRVYDELISPLVLSAGREK